MDGSLYAGIGDWEDPQLENAQTPGAQVLRLDSPTSSLKEPSALRHRARLDDGARPFLGTLLRQIMAGAFKSAMLVRGDELARVVRRAGVHAVRVAVDRDRRNRDRSCVVSAASIASY